MSPMNIIILGLGKIGTEIQKICQKNQIPIKAIISPNNRLATHKNIVDPLDASQLHFEARRYRQHLQYHKKSNNVF